MARKFRESTEFDLHGGRNVFRSDVGVNVWNSTESEAAVMRRNSAMRSFIESVDYDLPPAPELPPSLNIDLQYPEEVIKKSETSETTTEKKVTQSIHKVISGTQKYPMMVPGPGHVDAEQELHASLLRQDDEGSESSETDMEIGCTFDKERAKTLAKEQHSKRRGDRDHDALRRGYSTSALERPRPTTPTSWCAIENYVDGTLDTEMKQLPVAANEKKIRVSLPNCDVPQTPRRRRASMSWSDFYEAMSNQLISQVRRSISGRTTPLNDYDGDILEENPRYHKVAPPKPVIHRRASTDWESFGDGVEAKAVKGKSKDTNIADFMENSNGTRTTWSESFSKESLGDQKVSDDVLDSASAAAVSLSNANISQMHMTDAANNDLPVITSSIQFENKNAFDKQPTGYEECNLPSYIYEKTQGANDDYDSTVDEEDYKQLKKEDMAFGSNPHIKQTGFVPTYQCNDHQKPEEVQASPQQTVDDHNRPPFTMFSHETSQYDHSQKYEQSLGCSTNVSSYVQSPSNQYYTNQTGGESYPDGSTMEAYYDYDMQLYNPDTVKNNTIAENTTVEHQVVVAPKYMAPLFPPVVRPLEPNPFSWELQESKTATISASQQSLTSCSDNSKPTPSCPETFQHGKEEKGSYGAVPQTVQKFNQKAPPPPRPAPPLPSTQHTAPPSRPPLPSLSRSELSNESSHRQALQSGEPDEDAWVQFKNLVGKASEAVKVTEEKLKILSEATVAKDIKDESYLAQIGGSQTYMPEHAYSQTRKQQEVISILENNEGNEKRGKSKKTSEADLSFADNDDMDRAAIELAKKMAAMRVDLQDWKPPTEQQNLGEQEKSFSEISEMLPPPKPKRDEAMIGGIGRKTSDIQEASLITQPPSHKPDHICWTEFEDSQVPQLPPSESGFFMNVAETSAMKEDVFGDPFAPPGKTDAFTPINEDRIHEDYDPFNVRSADDLVEAAKARAAAAMITEEIQEDLSFFGNKVDEQKSDISTSTQEGGSLGSSRPAGFEDEFHVDDDAMSTPSPLYDEDDSEVLTEFPAKFTGDGWEMMIRYPIKKKLMADRYWKPCYVKIRNNTLHLFNSKTEQKPFMEILLQATYSLSDPTLQAYDAYGKIHTVKLQYVFYKERVGIRPGQISRLVEGHVTKYGLPLEHSAQCTVLLKFGSLNAAELLTFVTTVEDILFRCEIVRNATPIYKQDEVQIHCYDEYAAYVDKFNILSDQKARVRLFCLAFVSGSPILEIGLNDRRRQGKEVVRRKDILPMYTERWIRFENLEFHKTVDKNAFEKEQVIRLSPPDGCFFEVMRFRVRPPKNREKPLTVKSMMKIAGSKVEIRIEAMAAAQAGKTRGGRSTKRQVPCEDIQIRFPVPEAWIYLFREDRRWGVGSVHAKVRRPGKVKNLKDRLMGTVQNIENSLIEAAIGEAKYEHVFRALVWRIPRLPEKHHAAYKEHLLRCRFELSSFDLMPETFEPTCDVEFTMPLAMISNTVVRSVSIEQHEDSDRVEKFVRYVAKCTYKVEIDYVQCSDLDVDGIFDPTVISPETTLDTVPEPHKPMFNPDEVKELHEGYRIDFSAAELGGNRQIGGDSSCDDEEDPKAIPLIQIDMKGYGY